MTSCAASSLFLLMMISAAMVDVVTLRIPNRLSLAITLIFFPAALLSGMPWQLLGTHILAGFALLVIGFLLFASGAIGGGDAKLLAAAGLWIGWPAVLPFLVWTGIAGFALALLILAISIVTRHFDTMTNKADDPRAWRFLNVPYGIALATGAILAIPNSWWSHPST